MSPAMLTGAGVAAADTEPASDAGDQRTEQLVEHRGHAEHPAPSLQRLRPIAGSWKDYPLTDAFYTRGVGSGFVTGVVLW
jgi:hypothetical protein